MTKNLRKILITIILIVAVIIITPTNAAASFVPFSHQWMISANSVDFLNEKILTPQARQELQAVRQRRNHEIIQIINQTQKAELDRYVRSGEDMETAVQKLNLDRNQWDTVQAIVELSRLKIKAILARHALL